MFFGKSFLLSLVIEKLLSVGANVALEALDNNQEKIDTFIRAIIPGDLFDESAVQFVKANLPLVIEKVKELVGAQAGVSNTHSVASVLKQVEHGLVIPATITA